MTDLTAPESGAMIRIGNCSGYYGDRLSAMREMLEASAVPGQALDYLTGDYLAELTMLILGRDRMKDPTLGYAKTFVTQMTDCMALAQERGVRIVTNAGGLNPAGLAAKLREVAAEQGLEISIAHVEGDDLRERADELAEMIGLSGTGLSGTGLSGTGLSGTVLTANAYLGAFGIAAALDAGADVVVTGRVTDASVVVGPAISHFGWGRGDLDRLAGAVVAGHVIECGTQATGGNFSGFSDLDTSRPLGFPIAEVSADGTCVITRHTGDEHGGAVTVDTVTAQLLYEVQGPVYLNPDVAVHLDTIALEQQAPDRVAVTAVVGTPPPDTTKVCLNTVGGFRNSVEFLLTGLQIPEKAAWVRAQMESALAAAPPEEVEWHLDRTDVFDPTTQAQATSRLRCDVRSAQPDPVGRAFSDAAVQIALASYPGFALTAPPGRGAPYGVYRAAYVPQAEVPHRVHLADGTVTDIASPVVQVRSSVEPRSHDAGVEAARSSPPQPAESARRPLGEIAFARSGDKGGDANVGVWIPADHPRRADATAWLIDLLDVDAVKALLPETDDLDVEVHPLPNLGGVNIVIHGLLGEGVASSTRLDPQAKAVGEWLRARVVMIPPELWESELVP